MPGWQCWVWCPGCQQGRSPSPLPFFTFSPFRILPGTCYPSMEHPHSLSDSSNLIREPKYSPRAGDMREVVEPFCPQVKRVHRYLLTYSASTPRPIPLLPSPCSHRTESWASLHTPQHLADVRETAQPRVRTEKPLQIQACRPALLRRKFHFIWP